MIPPINTPPGHDPDSFRKGYIGVVGGVDDWVSHQAGQNARFVDDLFARQQAAGGGGGEGIGCSPTIITAPVMFAIGVPVFCVLYPLTIAAAAGASFGLFKLAERFVPHENLGRAIYFSHNDFGAVVVLAAPLIGGIIALWIGSRIEHRLARFRFYRYPRHLLRMVILAGIGAFIALGYKTRWDDTNFTALPPKDIAMKLCSNPWNFGVLAGSLLLIHLILTFARGPRESWHEMLEGWGLRPAYIDTD